MSFPFTVPLTAKEIRTPTSTQRAPLGTRGQTADGRVFYYAKAGATALVKGYLCQAEAPTTQWTNATFAPWATDFLATLGTTYIPAGTTYLYLTATGDSNMTVAKDYFKEGWVWVSGTATGCGQLMRIKTHNVASSGSTGFSSTGGKLRVEFDDGYALSDAIDTGNEISMMKNPYDAVIVAATAPTAAIVGVAPCDVTASYYFWIQTWGACPIKLDTAAAVVTNKEVVNSSAVAGCLISATGATGYFSGGVYAQNQRCVGFGLVSTGMSAIQASTNILVHLTIAP